MTTQGAGFVKGVKDSSGNYRPAGSGNNGGSKVAELSSHEDIQEAGIDNPDEDLVAELEEDGSATIREIEEEDNVVSISVDRLNNSRLSRFFTEEELSSLRQKEDLVEGEDGPSDYEEAMEGMRKDVERHNKEVAKKRRQMEVRRAKEELKKGTKYDPNRSVSDLSGEEFKEIIQEANNPGSDETQSEELQKTIKAIDQKYEPMLNESEPEINDPSTQIDELDKRLEAWKDSEKEYWHEFARDLEKSDESTMRESIGPNSVRLTTQEEEMKEALREPENFNGTVELEEDTGDTVIAVVRED